MTIIPFRPIVLLCAFFFLFLTGGSAMAGPVVLFDQAHSQQFLAEGNRPLDLSGLATIFREQGGEIRTGSTPLSDQSLRDVAVLIISGPFAPLSPGETAAVIRFVARGGSLAVMAHITQPLMGLLPQLDIAVSSLAVSEQENIIAGQPKNFLVKNLTSHPLTRDLQHISIYGGWALLAKNPAITVVARTSPRAWVDLNSDGRQSEQDAMQPFAMVLAGSFNKGRFVVFGDDALFQNQFLTGDNQKLAHNLATWLLGPGLSI
ncbi:MAG: DUF4350 domain-containing protein [Thermodesulfobacteriota bacterium]